MFETTNKNVIVSEENTWFDGSHGGVYAYSLSGAMIQVDLASADTLNEWWNEFLLEANENYLKDEELKGFLNDEEITPWAEAAIHDILERRHKSL